MKKKVTKSQNKKPTKNTKSQNKKSTKTTTKKGGNNIRKNLLDNKNFNFKISNAK